MSTSTLLLVLFDASVKALLIAAVVWIGLRVLRISDANIRHRAWSIVAISMMLLPLLSITLPPLSIPIPVAWLDSNGRTLATDFPEYGADYAPPANATESSPQLVATESQHAETPAAATVISTPEPTVAQNNGAQSNSIDRPHLGVGAVASIYVVVATLFALRLLAGVLLAIPLTRQARALPNIHQRAYQSNRIATPVTIGFLSPRILLPQCWRQWSREKLESVIDHEQAHIRRRDYATNLLAEFNRCLHWFNPLAWLLVQNLSDLAEQVCDDAVISQRESRASYARHLLEIAATNVGKPTSVVCVAMARSGDVESRIEAILDMRRPLSRKLSLRTALVMLFVLAPLMWIAAVATPTLAQRANDPKPATESVKQTTTGVTVLSGAKTPLAGVTVVARHSYLDRSGNRHGFKELARGETDPSGKVTLEYVAPEFPDLRGATQTLVKRHGLQFIAMASGHSIGFSRQQGEFEPVEIELVKPVALTGRLVDLEGQPIANAKVEVVEIQTARDPLDDWWKKAAKNPGPNRNRRDMMSFNYDSGKNRPVSFPQKAEGAVLGMIPVVTSDASGKFRIPDLGEDRLITLRIHAAGLARTETQMITRQGPSVYQPYPRTRFRDGRYHGDGAVIPLEPGATIKGRVVSKETGDPIESCVISVRQIPGSLESLSSYASVKTDKFGKYSLNGLPLDRPDSRGFTIDLTPPAKTPYFKTEYRIRLGNKTSVTHDVELKKARWIRGKVTNKVTGEAVRSMVGYFPFNDNKNAANYANFQPGMRTLLYTDFRWNNDDGSFQIPAIEGRGVLCVTAERLARYQWAGNTQQIKGLVNEKNRLNIYHVMLPTMVSEFREVNLGASDADPEIGVELIPHSSHQVQVVDELGKDVTGCVALGLMPDAPMAGRDHWSNLPPMETNRATVIGLDVESPRQVLFFHVKRGLGAIVEIKQEDFTDNKPMKVTLKQSVSIKGQLVDAQGKPVPDKYVFAEPVTNDYGHEYFGMSRGQLRFSTPGAKTDEQGRFVIDGGVFEGLKYQVNLPRSQQFKTTPTIVQGEPVDVGQLKPEAPESTPKVNAIDPFGGS